MIIFECKATRSLAGIHTVNPVDISNARIKAKLYSGGIVTCFLSILPSTEPFEGASYNKGYDIGIWEDGGTKLFIYSGEKTIYRQKTLKANPETIEIVLDGDTIRFLEEGVEVYSETYKPPSKLCNIYLWGHHWWYTGSGTSWADDFEVSKELGEGSIVSYDAPASANPGTIIEISVTAKNIGSVSDSFRLRLQDRDENVDVDTTSWLTLAEGASTTKNLTGTMPEKDWNLKLLLERELPTGAVAIDDEKKFTAITIVNWWDALRARWNSLAWWQKALIATGSAGGLIAGGTTLYKGK